MNLHKRIIYLMVWLGFCSLLYSKPVKVVCTIMDMADFTRQIGGDLVEVHSILNGQYDPHFFEPRPSEVIKLQKADMLIVAGMEVDAFVQGLLDASRNPLIRYGAPGFVDPSIGVKARDVPVNKISGAMGDVHPFGNPHYWFSPENVRIACRNITDGLKRVSSENKDVFEEGFTRYMDKIDESFERLKKRMAPHNNLKILQYHPSWDYFCDTFALQIVGTIEPKPGIPPSISYLSDLVSKIHRENIRLILVEPFYPEKPLTFLKSKTDIQSLRLPLFLGGRQGISTYLENLEYMVETISKAVV